MTAGPRPAGTRAAAGDAAGGAGAPSVLFVCTGNATRSVIAARLLGVLRPGWPVRSAGTLVVEGRPLSWRTRDAMAAVGLDVAGTAGRHATRQLDAALTADADLVVCMEAAQVAYVRRAHPEAAARTATLRQLIRGLSPGGPPLRDRVAALDLAAAEPDPADDVDDPGGLEADAYLACAHKLAELMARLVPLLD